MSSKRKYQHTQRKVDVLESKLAELKRKRETFESRLKNAPDELAECERELGRVRVVGKDASSLLERRERLVGEIDDYLLQLPAVEDEIKATEIECGDLKAQQKETLKEILSEQLLIEINGHDELAGRLVEQIRRLLSLYEICRREGFPDLYRTALGPGHEFLPHKRLVVLRGFDRSTFLNQRMSWTNEMLSGIVAELKG